MPFTDEDLRALKAWDTLGGSVLLSNPKKLDALLARLEASETAIRYLFVVCQDDRESIEYSAGVQDEAEMAMKDWRKASGKEPKL